MSDARRHLVWFAALFAVLLALQLAAPLEPTADLHSARLYARMALGRLPPDVTPTVTTPKPLATLVALPAELLGGGETFARVVAAALGALLLTLATAVAGTPLAALAVAMTPAFADDLLALGNELWAATLLLALLPAWRRPAAGLLLLALGLLRPEAWLLSFSLLAASWFLPAARPVRAAALIGLAAPLIWWAGDWILFGDAFFSARATRLYQGAIALEAAPASWRALAWDLARLLRSLATRGGPALVLLVLLPWCARGRRDRLGLVLAAAAAFLLAAVALRARGYPVFARFLDPVLISALVLAVANLRGALARRSQARPWLEIPIALLLLFACAPARVAQWAVLRDRRATSEAAMAAVRAAAEAPGDWLVDNDLASVVVAEGVLPLARVRNLQRTIADQSWPDSIAGLVFDDRFHFATIGDPRLADRVPGLRERVRLDAGLVRVLSRP